MTSSKSINLGSDSFSIASTTSHKCKNIFDQEYLNSGTWLECCLVWGWHCGLIIHTIAAQTSRCCTDSFSMKMSLVPIWSFRFTRLRFPLLIVPFFCPQVLFYFESGAIINLRMHAHCFYQCQEGSCVSWYWEVNCVEKQSHRHQNGRTQKGDLPWVGFSSQLNCCLRINHINENDRNIKWFNTRKQFLLKNRTVQWGKIRWSFDIGTQWI